ncbi:MAG: YabP/YqfC family sporulation protein [Oscillospiraceae bacterium]|jgi:sporulation protein YqfC
MPYQAKSGGTGRFGLPPEVLPGAARVTLHGAGEVLIENHGGLKSYSSGEIEVLGRNYTLRIRGEDLSLDAMTKNEIYISGIVSAVELC